MKKSATFLILLLVIFSLTLALAEDNETTVDPNQEKISRAFECLEQKAGDCSGLTTQEIALTILATPDNIFDDCVDELLDRKASDHWGNIRDTAMAILALNHAGQETVASEEWLIRQNQTPEDLTWYLQQDSNQETECHIVYDSNDYTINVGADKKINKDAGLCLKLAQLDFWLEVEESCYNKDFRIECDKDFIANLIYKNKDSPTIYVLEGTQSSPAFGSIELDINSKCFGDNSCDYESTAWAALALLKKGYNVEEFIPYIVAMSDTNERYLPKSFIYILTNYEDYASSLIESQKLGNYWEADSSAYSKYYDTSLAIIALGSSSAEQITNAKSWMLFSQGINGCWRNEVIETAIALWALEGKAGRVIDDNATTIDDNATTIDDNATIPSTVTYCTQANYFCIPSTECSSIDDVGDNYFCPSLSETCCMKENLKSCSALGGQICSSNEVCTGNSRKATDTNNCCTGSCQERPEENECETNFYTCMDSCSEFQEPMSIYSCDQGQVCCRTKTTPTPEEESMLWIWILVVLIIIVLIAIAYVYREQLKLYWFQLKTKFKKDEGEGFPRTLGGSRPGFPPRGAPPRPGFPPVRRMAQKPQQQVIAPPQKPVQARRDKAMSDTFQKLREMSK